MEARHPQALEGVGGNVPDAVTLGGEDIPVGADGTLACTRQQARTLARLYDVDYERVAVEGETDSGPTDGAICGAEMSDGSTCERLADECPYHE